MDRPWLQEPDREAWTDEATGYPCLIKRIDYTGALCGYVGLELTHPYALKHYDELPREVHDGVHGGVTFGATGLTEDPKLWWFGFDCAHLGDLMPHFGQRYVEAAIEAGSVYRDFEYVKRQTTELARLLQALEE